MLVALSPDARTRAGSAVFVGSALLLFGVSAAYHCGNWSPRTWFVLRRLDHCNIFMMVAGSCTAYALLLLDARDSVVMLGIVWSSALLGSPPGSSGPRAAVAVTTDLRRLWLGCAALPPRHPRRGVATRRPRRRSDPVLLVAGGALYVTGAVVYFFQQPDPWPRWFGFHEVFHAFTVLAFASHYVGITLATYSMR